MVARYFGRMVLAGTMAIGLASCADGDSSGYGRMANNSDYDRYYGDSQGYSSVPYGYAGSNFGWSQGYYYPGTGGVVYSRKGQQRNLSSGQRRYWEQRAAHPSQGNGGRDEHGRKNGDKHGNRGH